MHTGARIQKNIWGSFLKQVKQNKHQDMKDRKKNSQLCTEHDTSLQSPVFLALFEETMSTYSMHAYVLIVLLPEPPTTPLGHHPILLVTPRAGPEYNKNKLNKQHKYTSTALKRGCQRLALKLVQRL